MNQNGRILFETAFPVAIATGFERKSSNAKTSDMVQIWFLNRHEHPIEAQETGADKVVCGNCPLRPVLAKAASTPKEKKPRGTETLQLEDGGRGSLPCV